MLKLIYILPLLLIPLLVPMAWATPLEGQQLIGESSGVSVDIKFGQDDIHVFSNGKERITPTLESVTMNFFGDSIDLSDSDLRISNTGNHFRISNVELGIIMYGHFREATDTYTINVYLTGADGFQKYPVTTAFHLPDDKVVETEVEENEPFEEKPLYIPELDFLIEHDFRTYWQDSFDVYVKAFDINKNSDPSFDDFNGAIHDADVTVIVSHDDEKVVTMQGKTNNGYWDGSYYFVENTWPGGEYIVDVIVNNLGESVSKTVTMFVIGDTIGGGSSNQAPIANAGSDVATAGGSEVTLNGSGSFDPEGNDLTYLWTQTSGTDVGIDGSTTVSVTFNVVDTSVFELTVSDGIFSTSDTVTVTVS